MPHITKAIYPNILPENYNGTREKETSLLFFSKKKQVAD
tara:strand:- start:207 stop:323 length:117 start_codon:yes stop_codon:yes gene_type:complete